jgi:hypothetical protein
MANLHLNGDSLQELDGQEYSIDSLLEEFGSDEELDTEDLKLDDILQEEELRDMVKKDAETPESTSDSAAVQARSFSSSDRTETVSAAPADKPSASQTQASSGKEETPTFSPAQDSAAASPEEEPAKVPDASAEMNDESSLLNGEDFEDSSLEASDAASPDDDVDVNALFEDTKNFDFSNLQELLKRKSAELAGKINAGSFSETSSANSAAEQTTAEVSSAVPPSAEDGILTNSQQESDAGKLQDFDIDIHAKFDGPEISSSDEFLKKYRAVSTSTADEIPDSDHFVDVDIPGMKTEPANEPPAEDPIPEEPTPADFEASFDSDTEDSAKKESSSAERREKVNPLVSMAATLSARRRQRRETSKSAPPEDAEDLGPEVSAESAFHYYGSGLRFRKVRATISLVLTLISCYLAFGLPVTRKLEVPQNMALLCLVLELAVIVCGNDIFTNGLLRLVRGKPCAESLVSISCIVTALDAVIIAITNDPDMGMPLCAVSAAAMTGAEYGALYYGRSNRRFLLTLAKAKDPSVLTSEPRIAEDFELTVLKTKTNTTDFVRRTEEMALDENLYAIAFPFLCIGAVVFALIAMLTSHNYKDFMHILATIFAPAAPICMMLSYSYPVYHIVRSKLSKKTAFAGWSGLNDIGETQHLVIRDDDIFPQGTVSIVQARVVNGRNSKRIVSYAGSLLIASGSELAPLFREFLEQNNLEILEVENFHTLEGGGFAATIRGDEVYCGTESFVKLRGVHLPKNLASPDNIYVSINEIVSAIFTMSYKPDKNVQKGLNLLLKYQLNPIFAMRDFMITPRMLHDVFKVHAERFSYASSARQFEIANTKRGEKSKPSAIIDGGSLYTYVRLTIVGHKLFNHVRLSCALSLISSIIGVLMMFILCATGGMAAATAGNLLIYMAVWLVLEIILTHTMRV